MKYQIIGKNIVVTDAIRYDIEKKLAPLVKAGYVRYDGERVSLTPEGFLVSNSVIETLIF